MKGAAVLGLLCIAAAAHGQSLADAAQRAEEARNTTPSVRTFTNDSLPGEWPITTGGLSQYARARTDIAVIRKQHADVHQRLWNASMTAAALFDLEAALKSEPLVVAALDANGLTAHEYLRREQALVNAEAHAYKPRPPEDADRNSVRWANMIYLRNARVVVESLERPYRAIERDDIWWGAWRFVQE